MPLELSTFNDLVLIAQNALASAAPNKITNLRSGSVAYALIQAAAGNTLAQEQLIAHIYATERLATSTGADVDSFVNDFGLTRLPAIPTTGSLTLTRTSGTSVLGVPLGSLVATNVTGIQFQIIADINQSAYNPITQQYQFGVGVTSITVTVQCTTPGSLGNIAANTLTVIVSGITGVTQINNAQQFVDGADAETDSALKVRFIAYIGSLATANIASIENAIISVQPNITYQLIEYLHFDGSAFVAGFTVVADDGTGLGNPPFLAAVQAAVEKVRAAGSQFEVHAPTNVTINVSCTVAVIAGTAPAVAQLNAQNAITAYIRSLGVGVNVSYSAIQNAATNAAGVFSITDLLVNGGETDVTILDTELAVTGTVTFG
jgi:uncharacterized phage protein gp47/JayE